MADVSELEQKINILQFEISLLQPGNPQGEEKKTELAKLQRELAFAKIRQGLNN